MTVPLAARLVEALSSRGETVSSAESLTGGLVTAALTAVPGSSAVLLGGIVAYATPLKAELLGVDVDLLDHRGAVDADVALAMALGVRERTGSTYGLATTGVAGPDPSEGKAVGTVFVAVCGPRTTRVQALALAGDRQEIRTATVGAVLGLLAQALDVPWEDGRAT